MTGRRQPKRGRAGERTAFELRERTKELRCVYGLSKIRDTPGSSLERMLQGIVELLPPAWQYPDLACARLILEGAEYHTRGFVRTRTRQAERVCVHGRRAGFVEVCYRRTPPRGQAGTFLKAERRLLRVIAERLGKMIEHKRAADEMRASHERLRELLRGVERAREDERRRIAHELHDELGHALMALKMDVGCLKDEYMRKEGLMEKAQSMTQFIDVTLRNLKRVASELKPVLLDDFGLPAAVSSLAKDFESRHGVRCRVKVWGLGRELDAELSIVLYRIIQELLTNIARHSQASNASIELGPVGARLVLNVKDDGRGIRQEELFAGKTLGLLGIRERIHGWKGTLQIQGAPGRGTAVRIKIPHVRGRARG